MRPNPSQKPKPKGRNSDANRIANDAYNLNLAGVKLSGRAIPSPEHHGINERYKKGRLTNADKARIYNG